MSTLRDQAQAALAEPDEEMICHGCHEPMAKPDLGLEPAPLCNLCAQDMLPDLADAVLHITDPGLRERIASAVLAEYGGPAPDYAGRADQRRRIVDAIMALITPPEPRP